MNTSMKKGSNIDVVFNTPLWIFFQSTSYALNHVVADVLTTSHAIDLIPTRIT